MEKLVRINLLWVISILLLVIAGLLLRTPSGSYVVDFISFASSLASLILAVVAIFYSIISNQGFYRTISSLTKLAEQIRVGSDNINSTGQSFLERASDLLSEIRNVPGSVEQMAAQLDEKLSSLVAKKEPVDPTESKTGEEEKYYPRSTVGANISAYLIAKSYLAKKPFEIDKIFTTSPSLRSYVQGFLHSLAITSYKGLDISFSNKHHEINGVGQMDTDYILKKAEGRSGSLWKKSKDAIDAYFEPVE